MFLLLILILFWAKGAQCAEDLTQVNVNTIPVFAIALIVITAIAAMWIIKKLIKLGNRS